MTNRIVLSKWFESELYRLWCVDPDDYELTLRVESYEPDGTPIWHPVFTKRSDADTPFIVEG